MRYLLWLLKFALFVLVLSFAVKNTEMVTVRYYLGHEWRAPLVFILLLFFCVGAAFGILASLTHLIRQRREIAALKRDVRKQARGGDSATTPSDAA